MARVLLVQTDPAQCGVHQNFGRFAALLEGRTHHTIKTYVRGPGHTAVQAARFFEADALLWNYHPTPTPPSLVTESRAELGECRQIGYMHEVYPAAGCFDPLFDACLTIDPTMPVDQERTFRTVPILPAPAGPGLPWNGRVEDLVVGSFGFATDGKGYAQIIDAVAAEFPGCTLRLHIPYATYGDADGARALGAAETYPRLGAGRGIRVEVTHAYLSSDELVDYLADNHLNCLFYEPCHGRGVSGALEYALAARRPLALTESDMFRHVPRELLPRWPAQGLSTTIQAGTCGVEQILADWSPARVIADVEQMLDKVCA